MFEKLDARLSVKIATKYQALEALSIEGLDHLPDALDALCPLNCSLPDFLKRYFKHFHDLENANLNHFTEGDEGIDRKIYNILKTPEYYIRPDKFILTLNCKDVKSVLEGLDILLQGIKILLRMKNAQDAVPYMLDDLIKNLLKQLKVLIRNPELAFNFDEGDGPRKVINCSINREALPPIEPVSSDEELP